MRDRVDWGSLALAGVIAIFGAIEWRRGNSAYAAVAAGLVLLLLSIAVRDAIAAEPTTEGLDVGLTVVPVGLAASVALLGLAGAVLVGFVDASVRSALLAGILGLGLLALVIRAVRR